MISPHPDPAMPLPPLSAILLAGGAGRRVGGQDKGLLQTAPDFLPLIGQVCARLPSAVQQRLISCNRNLPAYAAYGQPVVDRWPDYPGPLAGLLSALPHCQHDWVLVAPCDLPHYPTRFAAMAWQALQQDHFRSLVAVAHDGRRRQNLCLLLHRHVLPSLADYFPRQRAVAGWLDRLGATEVTGFDENDFLNLNRI